MFLQEVNKRNRKSMTDYLTRHFRYHTINSWNRSTSYANCIKVHYLEMPNDIDRDIWWDMLCVSQWHDDFNQLLDNFGRKYNYVWQAGTNGRSGGYIVLYRGGQEPSGYKSYCTNCGQRNYKAVPEKEKGICGRCDMQTRINYTKTHMRIFTYPGKHVDMGENFREWTIGELQDRVELVQEFDALCDAVVAEYCYYCRNYTIEDEEILVPKTIQVLRPVAV